MHTHWQTLSSAFRSYRCLALVSPRRVLITCAGVQAFIRATIGRRWSRGAEQVRAAVMISLLTLLTPSRAGATCSV